MNYIIKIVFKNTFKPYPQEAASTIAIQYASVKEVFKKMCPRLSTLHTCECSKLPNNVTCSPIFKFVRISSSNSRLGPSPPIINCTYKMY